MPKTKTENTTMSLDEMKIKLADTKLNIKSGLEKNTNAHKKLKKDIARLLTKSK